MAHSQRRGKHLLLPELQKWYDTLPSITWNDFKSAQEVRAFLEPPGSNKSSYGTMPSGLQQVYARHCWL